MNTNNSMWKIVGSVAAILGGYFGLTHLEQVSSIVTGQPVAHAAVGEEKGAPVTKTVVGSFTVGSVKEFPSGVIVNSKPDYKDPANEVGFFAKGLIDPNAIVGKTITFYVAKSDYKGKMEYKLSTKDQFEIK